MAGSATGQAQDRPNILILFPDEVGWANVGAYGQGVMGCCTPNIDRIAREGAMFTEHYAQPSCTAGRAALIMGQYPIRSGMTTVGRPGAALGLKPETPTLGEILKAQGCATGQFGKNHLGDRNEHLPTVHGFDEFFGNLYHLNTEEESEQFDYPKDPEFAKKYGTRGVLRCTASDVDDATVDPRFGKMGRQTCEDTGPLTRKRMETVDDEFVAAATTEHDAYGSGLIEHDLQVGKFLDDLKAMGVLDNTIIVYSTDNGPEHSARTHGGTTPFRREKMTTYEGGVRVPMMVRWPGRTPAGRQLGGIQAHMDIFATVVAAAGIPDVAERIRKERKQYIDGVNNLDYWTEKTAESARDSFLYYYESTIKAIRYRQLKLHFETSENYYAPHEQQKFPIIYNLHFDPHESFDGTTDRSDIVQRKQWLNEPVQHVLTEHIQSLAEYPPVQKAAPFDFSKLIRQVQAGTQ